MEARDKAVVTVIAAGGFLFGTAVFAAWMRLWGWAPFGRRYR